MNTNDSNNPQNTGTGANSNYGTQNAGTGTSSTSGAGMSNPSSATDGDDYSATAKGAAVAGTAGAAAGSGVDAVQNTADQTAHSVTGQPYKSGSTMSGMFNDRNSAEQAYQSLHARGYSKDDVNLLMSDETRKMHFGDDSTRSDFGDKAMEGAGVGSAIGGTAGAIIGAIAAIGTSVALPGLGLIIAGPLAAALAGAGAGGLTGGLVGALVGSGIPEEHAAEYESGIKNGGIVMGVKPRNEDDAKYFEDEFRRNNGDKIYKY